MAEEADFKLFQGVHRMRARAQDWFHRACVRLVACDWSEPEKTVVSPGFLRWAWRGTGARVLTVVISDRSVVVFARDEETGVAAGSGEIDSVEAALAAWRWLQGEQERVTLDDDAGKDEDPEA